MLCLKVHAYGERARALFPFTNEPIKGTRRARSICNFIPHTLTERGAHNEPDHVSDDEKENKIDLNNTYTQTGRLYQKFNRAKILRLTEN